MSNPPPSGAQARYPYGSVSSAAGTGVSQPNFEIRPSLGMEINEALHHVLEPPSTSDDRLTLEAIMPPGTWSFRKKAGKKNFSSSSTYSHSIRPSPMSTRTALLYLCIICMFSIIMWLTLLWQFLYGNFRLCPISPSTSTVYISGLEEFLSKASLNSRQQYDLGAIVLEDGALVWEHLAGAEIANTTTLAFSSHLSPDRLYEIHSRFDMLNAAILDMAHDLLSSAKLGDETTHLVSELTTNISMVLTDPDFENKEAAPKWDIFRDLARNLDQVIDITVKRMQEHNLEKRLQDIRWLAAESGFHLGYPGLNDTPSTFETQLRQELGDDFDAFGKGNPMWERLAMYEEASNLVRQRRTIWRVLQIQASGIKYQAGIRRFRFCWDGR